MICLPAKILKFQLGMYTNVLDYVPRVVSRKARLIALWDVG